MTVQDRILWINPGLPLDGLNRQFEALLEKGKRKGTEVKIVSTGRGPRDLEYRYYEALVIPDILHKIKEAEKEGYDAAIIGCFYDPGLQAAREIADIVIVAPAEASMHLAATLGSKFSIIIGREKWILQMAENVRNYGMELRLSSFKSINLRVSEMQADKARTMGRMHQAAREAVEEDLAEVIIPGCTMEYGFSQDLQSSLKVPVIDPIIAAFKYAEFLCELKKRFGWGHSKRGDYERPPNNQILSWKLQEQYGVDGLW